MSLPDLSRARRACSRCLVHGASKRPGADDAEAWLVRPIVVDLAAAIRHATRALVDPGARDEESGELHVTHAATRLLLVVERLERRR